MRMDRRGRESKDIDVGAFADIAFLLIIFFILTTTFVKPAGDTLKIPAGEQKDQKEKEDKDPTVNLKPGTILWGEKNEEMSIEELRLKLTEMDFPNRPMGRQTVVVDSSPEVSYQEWFQVVMAINQAGGTVALRDSGGEEDGGGGMEGES